MTNLSKNLQGLSGGLDGGAVLAEGIVRQRQVVERHTLVVAMTNSTHLREHFLAMRCLGAMVTARAGDPGEGVVDAGCG